MTPTSTKSFLLRFVFPALVWFSIVVPAFSQAPDWVLKMQNPNADFADTRQAFEAYWTNRPVTKGSGWKPFKRWEYYMETRLSPDGTQSGPQRTLQEFQAYLRAHPLPANGQRSVSTANWREVGPVSLPANGTIQPNGMGRVNCVAFHPTDPGTLYIGSPSGGFWRSTDYGQSWSNLSTGLIRLGISSIVIDPNNPSLIYIGTGDRDGADAPGYGVWYSVDGGFNWQPRNTGMGNRTVNEILMHPANPSVLIAATDGPGRIYRSTNGGANWTQVYNGSVNFKDIAFKPGDPNTVYASGTEFYRSLDNGQSWNPVTNGVPSPVTRMALAVSPAQPATVYLFAGDNSGFNGLYKSTDSGTSFLTQSTTPNICGYEVNGGSGSQAWYDLVIIADPLDANHLYAGAINIWESFDGGQNWVIATHWYGDMGNPAVHADHHALEYSSHTGDLFVGCDGGVYFSSNAGATWQDISSGLAIAQVYKLGQSQTAKGRVINGYQDNGTAVYNEGSWRTGIGGDGMECIIDYTDESVMYGALYYGDIRRSTNGGISFQRIAANQINGITESGAWVTPYLLHPTNPNTMYVGYSNVWRSTNCKTASFNSVSWSSVSAFSGNNKIRAMAIAPSNPNVMYLSRDGSSNFYRTANASAANPTWTDLDANLPGIVTSSFPVSIAVHPTNPSRLWIAYRNGIYESTDAGDTWTDISGTLPNISLNTIVMDKNSPVEALYVGMDVGVYYRDNNMSDWVLFADGLPNVEITELEIYSDPYCRSNDLLRASTYGRGLWESELRDPGTIVPNICFDASETALCEGLITRLEDKSAHNPTSWTWVFSPATVSFVNGTNANSQHPQVAFSLPGDYTVTLTAGNASGTNSLAKVSYLSVSGSPQGLPAMQDFDGVSTCGSAGNCGATVCNLPGGWKNAANGTEDDIDWRLRTGGTPTSNTGPGGDATSGAGNYIYLEATSCFRSAASLISPCIDLTNASNPELSFAYHMYGAAMGELHLDIFANGMWTEDIIPVISGDQGNSWQTRVISLAAYSGSVVNLRFRGITGPGATSDMALDDISVGTAFPIELLDFSARLDEEMRVALAWITASEVDNNFFTVERSADGLRFEELAVVDGAGTSHEMRSYETLDRRPFTGNNYYRLRQTDFNGSAMYSDVVEIFVPWRGTQSAQLSQPYPDPFTDRFRMDLNLESTALVRVDLLNNLGQVVQQIPPAKQEAGWNALHVDASGLPAGIYHIRVTGYDFVLMRKAVLQR